MRPRKRKGEKKMEKKEEERLLAVFAFLPTGCEQCWWVNKERRGVMGKKWS